MIDRVRAIDDAARHEVLRAVVDDVRPTISHFGDYLLAAHEVLRAAAPGVKALDAKEIEKQTAAVADRLHLDAGRLGAMRGFGAAGS